jgi:hypothetical protein
MYSIFRYMQTITLTEEQKNYVFMLLIAGDLPENEIRMFLARSGWQLDAIDAGVVYSRDSALVQKLSQFKAPTGTAIPVTASASIASATTANQMMPIIERVTAPAYVPPASPSINLNTMATAQATQVDPYKESVTIAANEFKQSVMQNPTFATVTANTTAATIQKQVVAGSQQTISQVRTMPSAPKKSLMHGVLVSLAWLLFLVLIGLVAAIVGYMYYTGTGVFENVTYTKIF